MKTTLHCIQNTLMCRVGLYEKKTEIFSDENSTNNIYGLIFISWGILLAITNIMVRMWFI